MVLPLMKIVNLVLPALFALNVVSCAFSERQKMEQMSVALHQEDSKQVAATFFEALARGDRATYWQKVSPAQTRRNPRLNHMFEKEFEPGMKDFAAWSSSPSVAIVKNMDATAELPGPFFVVERMAKLKNGEKACFIAIVEFAANGRGYVSNLYRGQTPADARWKVRLDLNGMN